MVENNIHMQRNKIYVEERKTIEKLCSPDKSSLLFLKQTAPISTSYETYLSSFKVQIILNIPSISTSTD
jgi:hypothetical protein